MPGISLSLSSLGVVFILVITQTSEASLDDSFKEELYVKPISSGLVSFEFEFTTKWDVDIRSPKTFQHYRLFPKSLGEVISAYKVQELHLSLTQGLWRYEKWGYHKRDAPPGAELWVWFQENTTDVDRAWTELNHALSGLFCASLNFMDSKSTTSPKWSFRPSGIAPEEYARNSKYLRYSALPRELACTENLTPWKKLLPCDSKVGLATLFNTVNLYDANYHSLSIHVKPVCADRNCLKPAIELSQSLTVVFDTNRKNHSPDWTLKTLFNRPLTTQCPLAEVSNVYVDLSLLEDQNLKDSFVLSPPVSKEFQSSDLGEDSVYALYTVGNYTEGGKSFNLGLSYPDSGPFTAINPPRVYAQRYITGHGLEKGGVSCQLFNNMDQDLTVIYLETLPWYMRVYFHTLHIENNRNMTIKPSHVHYVPGKDRERLYTLEMVLTLKANSITTISFQFDRVFLKWTEYPPDANHGFYVNSAVISVNLPSSCKRCEGDFSFLRLHTESLLLQLPTPDFSMPYNVICLACTVVAIAFGSLHNLTTRRFQIVDPKTNKSIKEKIKDFLQNIFRRNKKDESDKNEIKKSKSELETETSNVSGSPDKKNE